MDEQKQQSEASGGGRSSLRRRILYALLGSGALAVVLGARPILAAIQDSSGFHRPWRGGWGHHHRMTPEAAKEHGQIATKWALREIDASEEQQDRVNKVVGGAIDDLFRLNEQHQANREALAAQLGGATIDRGSLEEIRKSEMALADEASRRLVQALADVADVLTPEQRQALLEHVHRHGR